MEAQWETPSLRDGLPVGVLTYRSGVRSVVVQPAYAGGAAGHQQDVHLTNQQQVAGMILPPIAAYGYQAVDWMPTRFDPTTQILNAYINELRNRYSGIVSGRVGVPCTR